jgi:uncharacterized protein (DUF2147 family)
MLRIAFTIVFVSLAVASAFAQVGTWKTIDEETRQAKSYIEIYEKAGKLEGKIVKLLLVPPEKKCGRCPGPRKGQPLMGMVLLEGMYLQDGYYQGGQILDPDKGKFYSCKMWLKEGDPNVLVMRGSLGPFYRTQYWYRVR